MRCVLGVRGLRGPTIITANEHSPIDLRKSQRYPTHIDGIAIFQGSRYPITIADISADGALIRGFPAVPPGVTLVVQARALEVVAIVVRNTARGAGIRFQSAVNPLAVVRENYAGLEHLRKAEPAPRPRTSAKPPEPEAWRTIE